MRLLIASLFVFLSMGMAAMACPSTQLASAAYTFTGNDLYTPKNFGAQAGGNQSLANCGLGHLGTGMFNSAPTYTFDLSGMQGYRLVLDVDSQCDAAMLVNAADGQWYFDDDSNGNLDPRIELTSAAQTNGRVNIWVGTFSGGSCNAVLNLETFLTQAPPTPQPAGGCPTWSLTGPSLTLTGDQLYSPQTYSTMASGGAALSNCPGINGFGYASAAPQYTLYLSGMENYRLEIQVQAQCDTTLLVNTADTVWHFDDDSNGNLNPRLDLTGAAALNGRVDVWVGTYGGGSCPASIEFETWLAGAQPTPTPAPGPTPSGGCPTWSMTGATYNLTGSDLYSPDTFNTVASGSTPIGNCGIAGTGYFNAAPNFSFYLSGMEEYGRLEIEVTASCDTVLLVNTADTQWYFDDDSNGNLNPRLDLRGPAALNGRVDVWIGTYGGGSCNANVELETWYN